MNIKWQSLLVFLVTWLVAAPLEAAVVYIADDGTGDGSSASQPLGVDRKTVCGSNDAGCYASRSSLHRGFTKVLQQGGGTVVIVGPVLIGEDYTRGTDPNSREFALPEHLFVRVKLTSVHEGTDYRNNKDVMLQIARPAHLRFYGEVVLENLTIQTQDPGRVIACSGAHCVFSEGIRTVDVDKKAIGPDNAEWGLSLAGGYRWHGEAFGDEGFPKTLTRPYLDPSQIEVYSGSYNRITGGLYGLKGDACDRPKTMYVQKGDAYIKIGGTTQVYGGIKVGANGCDVALLGDSHLWIEDGTFYGTIEGIGAGGFVNEGSQTWMRIDGGDFSNVDEIYGGSKDTPALHQSERAIVDLSQFKQDDTRRAALEKAIVRRPGLRSGGILRINYDKNNALSDNDGRIYRYEKINVEEERKYVIDYMNKLANMRWKTDKTYYSNPSFGKCPDAGPLAPDADPNEQIECAANSPSTGGGVCVWNLQEAGVEHVGAPYGYYRSSLEEFEFLCRNPKDGVCTYQADPTTLEVKNLKNDEVFDKNLLGFSCSSALYVAWQRRLNGVDTNRLNGSSYMIPLQNIGLLKVGDYPIDFDDREKDKTKTSCDVDKYLFWDTSQICKQDNETIKNAVYLAYKDMLPGDAVVMTQWLPQVCGGHVRTVKSKPTIDPSSLEDSTVEMIEQTCEFFTTKNELRTSWVNEKDLVNNKTKKVKNNVYTFKELYDEHYIPVRHRDFARKIRETPIIRVMNPETEQVLRAIRNTPDDSSNHFLSSILSNYRLYRGQIVIDSYRPDGTLSKKVVNTRFVWETVNKHNIPIGFPHRHLALHMNGYDERSYFHWTVRALRQQLDDFPETNMKDGRYRFTLNALAGNDDPVDVQQFDFVLGAGAYRRVIYHANGADSGEAPEDKKWYAQKQTATVLGNSGALAYEGWEFDGWNTHPQAKGVNYAPGTTLTLGSSDTTLYAMWKKVEDPVKSDGGATEDGGQQDVSMDGADAKVEGNDDGGCGCRVTGEKTTSARFGWVFAGLLAFAGWGRRRARRFALRR